MKCEMLAGRPIDLTLKLVRRNSFDYCRHKYFIVERKNVTRDAKGEQPQSSAGSVGSPPAISARRAGQGAGGRLLEAAEPTQLVSPQDICTNGNELRRW